MSEDTMTDTTSKDENMSDETVVDSAETVPPIIDIVEPSDDAPYDEYVVAEMPSVEPTVVPTIPVVLEDTSTAVPPPVVVEDIVEAPSAPEIPIDDTPALTIEDIEAMLAEQFPPLAPAEPFPGDDTATWHYWTEMDTAERGVPDEWVLERLRNRRNALIAESDWRVVPDAPWDTAPWIEYRQALRDLPANTTDPRKAEWPVSPDGVA